MKTAPILRIEFHFPKGAKLERGRCTVCGCRDRQACRGGCSWVDPSHGLCSACVLKALESAYRGAIEVRNLTDEDRDGNEFETIALVLDMPKPPAPRRLKGKRA